MRRLFRCTLLCSALATTVDAQSIARRFTGLDGDVQVIYPSRPSACGDGETFIGNVFGESTYYSGNSAYTGVGRWRSHPCVHGPARLVVTLVQGEVTRLRPYVGPLPTNDMRTLNSASTDVVDWLVELISHANSRIASDAMLPLVLADGIDPWSRLLRVARDENRPNAVRKAALTWLANGVNEKLGISDARGATDDDDVKSQAVFALSQGGHGETVPDLIDIARTAKNPAVRRSAIFWLGQTGDPRATELYAELLNLR